jgi:hypothetical protein
VKKKAVMRRFTIAVVGVLALLGLSSCDNYQIVDTKSEESRLVNLKSCKCEIISKDDLSKLREQAEIGKNIGRYQMRNEGYRTWRFDSATGRTCILLSSESDWKKPDTMNQSCELAGN